ncbi:hypothetical protein ESCO_003822 [Escovopsis weberi]|uniref:Ribonuclease H2 subunit B wHTH domain-containing protein n=1 Tax=Escovopsis weberi TaxID=150374 RepID=A0A0M8N195_ESCWE|nr:hypothetical protein ESCO_003822 [Escovopsis weberi]
MGSDLFVATSIDPLFLVLPVLFETNTTKGSEERERLFRQSDDLFEKLPQEDSHMSEVLRWPATRSLLEARMEVVCDTIEAGGETMFRLDEKKLLQVLLDKAKRMSRDGLPATLEERFVKRALEAPLALKKSEMADIKIETGDSDSDAVIMKTDSGISQSTLSTTGTNESSVSQLSTAATSISDEASGETLVSAMEASPEVTQLQRLRIAFDFICSTYVNTALASHLKQSLKNTEADAVDFSALDDYLARLETLRSETMATTTTADFSRRRRRDEEEEDERQEKKRKMEEAKKKKASESRALRDLKKVDTSGMKKLSAFFKKK